MTAITCIFMNFVHKLIFFVVYFVCVKRLCFWLFRPDPTRRSDLKLLKIFLNRINFEEIGRLYSELQCQFHYI